MFFLVKTLHLLGIALLASALLCQSFLFSRRQRISSESFRDLKRWTAAACYLGMLLVLGTGLHMALTTGLFLSEDDFWLHYKTALFVLFFFLVIGQQFRLNRATRGTFASRPLPRKRWVGVLVIALFCSALYISVAKPYLFNDPTIVFQTIETTFDSPAIEEIEEVETVDEEN